MTPDAIYDITNPTGTMQHIELYASSLVAL